MAFTYLISETFIKERTALDSNVDEKIIKPLIRDAQELYILPLLGTDLYDQLIVDALAFINNATAIPANYDVLLNTYVSNILLNRVMIDVNDFISLKMRNNGLIQQGNENGQGVPIQAIQRMSDKYEAKAEAWTARFEKWMCEMSDNFPEYTSNTDDGDISPMNRNHIGGLDLG